MNAIDLFAGAGGLTDGFKKAGARCALAIEFDPQAAETLKYNNPDIPLLVKDIREIKNNEAIESCKASRIDVVTGGPPCQGFSLAGLRIPDDPKNQLFLEFVRMVEIFDPKIVVFENVAGLLSMQKGVVLAAILKAFSSLNYSTSWKIVNTADYGIPQSRPRFIMVGIKGKTRYQFPESTHVDPKVLQTNDLFGHTGKLPYVTVKEALSSLPDIYQGDGEEEMPNNPPVNEYQKVIYGHRNPGILYNHRATKHSQLIVERYAAILPGNTNVGLPEHLQTKKINVFKLHPDQPARTVTCNFRTDLLHHYIPRGTTVREAARLQSFDDDYRFFGNLTRKARYVTQDDQVGNAVPPLLAYTLANSLKEYI